MPEGQAGRRAVYFAFQGLFVAVLLLIFLYQYRTLEGWVGRFLLLAAISSASLLCIQMVEEPGLRNWYFQVGLFMGDAVLASMVLRWTQHDSDLYLLYFFVIFGTALMRSLAQSLVVALLTSGLYLVSAWHPGRGFPHSAAFWLRVNLLWVSSILLAILSRDSRHAQGEVERRHQDRLVQFERLATLGQLAGEVAHRIKGPLTTIMVNAEVLSQRGGLKAEAHQELEQIREEVGHCRDILKGLLDMGRIEEMDETDFDLREPLRRALAALAGRLQKHHIRVAVSMAEPLPMRGDPVLMQEAVLALLHNAADSIRDDGRIELTARVRSGRPGWLGFWRREESLEVGISDDGRGIKPAELARLFEPFFTTKGRYGSGLGLSAALRILQKHGGGIEARSEGPGKGARFVLTVPGREV
ncbi:MAG: HAMP domain-containing histidine kinase [Elusimicrobia bacterium]|nr:HAMP domain-containing histidine kinase [Elusimicrobiota bacterium]